MTSRTSELHVVMGRQVVGALTRSSRGTWSLEYAESWRQSPSGFPISVSRPLAGPAHGRGAVSAFVSGLLPDNERVLPAWRQRFHVSPRNPFALLAHVGEDCASAVQLVGGSASALGTDLGCSTASFSLMMAYNANDNPVAFEWRVPESCMDGASMQKRSVVYG